MYGHVYWAIYARERGECILYDVYMVVMDVQRRYPGVGMRGLMGPHIQCMMGREGVTMVDCHVPKYVCTEHHPAVTVRRLQQENADLRARLERLEKAIMGTGTNVDLLS